MSLRLQSGGTAKVIAPNFLSSNIDIEHSKVSIHVSGESYSDAASQDVVFRTYTNSTYYIGGNININAARPTITFQNTTPDIAEIANDGTITRVSEGIAKIIVSDGFVKVPVSIDLKNRTVESLQPKILVSLVSGSLVEHLTQQVDNRINGSMTIAENGVIFTTQDHSAQNYVRNTALWCSDVDLTCISPWNSYNTYRRAGVAITPRHIMNAAHYPLFVGDIVRFIGADNSVHDVTIIGKQIHPNYNPQTHDRDFVVYTLDQDISAFASYCKVMPQNWTQYLKNNNYSRPPALGLDQEEKALVIDYDAYGRFKTPIDAARLNLNESIIEGDSSNPAFLIVNGELVLVTVWTWGGGGGGTAVSSYISSINQMIVDSDSQAGVSTGYTVTEADFSAFTNFG